MKLIGGSIVGVGAGILAGSKQKGRRQGAPINRISDARRVGAATSPVLHLRHLPEFCDGAGGRQIFNAGRDISVARGQSRKSHCLHAAACKIAATPRGMDVGSWLPECHGHSHRHRKCEFP